MISVIIPARNAAATIGATLSSLIADKTLIREILLIDDGSTDATVQEAWEAAHRHALPLNVTRVQRGSPGAARNAGLAQVRGEYVFYLDADDEVIPGGLSLLHEALRRNPKTALAVGSAIHRASRGDKLKIPSGYSDDRIGNARKYLSNELRSITIGSALIVADEAVAILFPETIGLDEDTCYWAAALTQVFVVTIEAPVLIYNLDEARMAQRFVANPRKVLLDISLELNRLAAFGIDKDTLQKRKVFIALRIARKLIRQNRYSDATRMMRAVQAHRGLRSGLKSIEYMARIRAGRAVQAFGFRQYASRGSATPDQMPTGRTLLLTCDPAFPPVSGADLRNYQNARAAAQLGPVLLVSVRPQNGRIPADGRVKTAALARDGEPRAGSLVRWRTSAEMRIPSPALPRLLAMVREFHPDTIIVEGIPLFALLEHLRPLTRQLILDMHNIESALAEQLRPARSPFRRLLPFSWSDRTRIQRLERRALTIVDRVWVCSDQDRENLHSLFAHDIPVDVVPNGIPRFEGMPASLARLPGQIDGWPVMLFVGHLGYQPNIVAAERLAQNILPLVRRTFPSARVILAGRSPKTAVQDLASRPGVALVANPEDLTTLFLRSHFTVMPLSAGGGTRIKILEAMGWGVPVVATSVAAEGQGFTDKEEIAISDTDEGLASLIVALCSDPGRVERQRRIAYEQARLRFGPSAIEGAVRKSLEAFDADV